MRLLDQFHRLAGLAESGPHHSLTEVATLLCCSERNARLLLHRMQQQGWLQWVPGRGRGHRSRLTLLQQPDALKLSRLHQLLAEGRLEAAFDGLPQEGQARLKQALPGFLGPNQAGGLRIPFYRPLHALDPIQVHRRTESHIVAQLCAGLTAYEREREAITPALAHHWECFDNGSIWHFWLRPDLRFHDGRPLQAHDAACSLIRLRDTVGPHQRLFNHLQDITAEGLLLSLRLSKPDHLLLHRLAHTAAVIVPAQDWLRADFSQLPVGAGPFRLVRNNSHRASLQAFDSYYGERPLLSNIDIWVVPDGSPIPDMDINLGHGLPLPADWSHLGQLEQGCDFVVLNPARPAFATASGRLALGAWLRTALPTLAGKQAASAYLPNWQHLPEVAPALPDLPRQLSLVTYQLDSHISLSQQIAELLRQAGHKVELSILSYPEFATFAWCGWADIAVAGEVMSDDLAFSLYGGLAGESTFHHWLATADRAWLAGASAAIAAEPDASLRAAQIETCYAHIVAEGWLLPLFHTMQALSHSPQCNGVKLARCGWMDFRKLWLRSNP
ncbi:SgrR family transcriptional regulator [Chitinimonas viridis]|uniref:SgrR family transcriptional regulator n=1 Tax=Chitinimonas viridis TaxID=664880 RepID=A0ABT8B258_9NEIS|nr:SgrR family transcriptional regulator [Chitinimonas viridis]MDN3576213.1 SgrR family transcriptional regulator [Chitinimonas viridis]